MHKCETIPMKSDKTSFQKYLKALLTSDYSTRHWKLREKYIKSQNKILKFYYFCKVKSIENKNNCEFGISFQDSSAVFGSRPYLPHGLNGIVISRQSIIGKNATIFHQVTIGIKMIPEMSTRLDDLSAPVIGNNVFIGCGAKIIGNIKIGDNVLIGSNCVVTKDVPDGYTVVGNPAKMFKTQNNYLIK